MRRRDILKKLALTPLLGGVAGMKSPVQSLPFSSSAFPKRDLFRELGLRTFINAAGNYTVMTGSLMPEEVMDAMYASSKKYVMLDEVQDKVGEKIAEICHAEAAFVTAGCWSALVLGMAGVLTGMDNRKVKRLPVLAGTDLKSEVIVQKSHAIGYEQGLVHAGVSIVTVQTRAELERAISEKTAMLWFLNREAPKGEIQHEEWIQLGRKYNLPVMIDIAADVPPVENLWKFNDMGFDLVAISGGKAMCGPQSAGILMGKKDLIAAARLNANPRSGVGRGQKVNKEEIIGMYVALEKYVNKDHAKEWTLWERKIAYINNALKPIPGVTTDVIVPPIDNHTPSLKISWDPGKIKWSSEELRDKLRFGNPSIEVISWEEKNTIRITVFMLQPGEEKAVAGRISQELKNGLV